MPRRFQVFVGWFPKQTSLPQQNFFLPAIGRKWPRPSPHRWTNDFNDGRKTKKCTYACVCMCVYCVFICVHVFIACVHSGNRCEKIEIQKLFNLPAIIFRGPQAAIMLKELKCPNLISFHHPSSLLFICLRSRTLFAQVPLEFPWANQIGGATMNQFLIFSYKNLCI